MGANVSLLAPNAHTVATRSYVDVLPDYRFLEVINNTRFLKTIKAYDAGTGTLVIIKVFVKPPQASVRLHGATALLASEAALLAPHACFLPWTRIIETDSAGYVVRQMARANLYDRLSLRPFLASAEKRWLVFQMLRAMALLHDNLHMCHGDLKTENFFVTSANWLVLADFAQSTKPVYLPEDNPSEFVFYFDSSNRRTCYVAPERFFNKTSKTHVPLDRANWTLAPAADLFSLGCVVAELYMDGEPPFTLSELYRYKKGEQEPSVAGIADADVQKMVRNLLLLDPSKRHSALQILASHRGSFFPEFFYGFLYNFMADLNTDANFVVDANDDSVSPSDLRIEKIHSSFDEVVAAFDFVYPEQDMSPNDLVFPYLKLSLRGLPPNHVINSRASAKSPSQGGSSKSTQGALIMLDTVFALLRTIRRPSNKVKACEIILALSEHVGDEAKLDRSLPYLCSFLDEFIDKISQEPENIESDPSHFPNAPNFSSNVASTSIIAMTNLLRSCSSINTINAHVFPDYIYPKLKSLAFLSCSLKDELNYVKSTLSSCLPHLIQISNRFAMLVSKSPERAEEQNNSAEQLSTVAARCENDIKDITEALLTDTNVNVRIRLLSNILPLCQYFGVDKTNDIILPHLITYLNDPSFQLRLAFLSSIESIGHFIGVLAFEQYLLPLLVQTLGDHEPFIVLKVLQIFNYFVSARLINPKAQFNALSIYRELLTNTLMLLLQPNEWMRQSVVCLILSISDNLLNADRFCFLYPLIKTYLSYDILVLSWDQLYPCLTKPLSRPVFELALTWLTKSSGKSLFWKQASVSFYKSHGKRKLVKYSKEMGKSVYIGNPSGSSIDERRVDSEISLSYTDRQWILKLKSIGLEETDLWKISALRPYLTGIIRSGAYTESGDDTNFKLATHVNIAPLNVFCEIRFKSEDMTSRQKKIESAMKSQDQSYNELIPEKAPYSLSLTHGGKAKPSLQTNESNIFAELNPTHANTDLRNLISRHSEAKQKDSLCTHKVFCATNERIISVSMRHNFEGNNPHVISYLRNINFRPTLADFPEFGPLMKNKILSESQEDRTFDVKGTLVTRINTNFTAKSIDAVTKVTICPSSEFFVSGSESGALKVWDTSKLESASAKTALLSLNLSSEITEIVFLPNRLLFAVATTDGQIRIFTVHVVRGKNRKIIKYSRMSLIRVFKLDGGFARAISFARVSSQELLVAATSSCQIVAYDVIKTTKVFDLQSPPEHGVPTTFIISKTNFWLLLGTTEGVLSFWDIRFQVLLRCWNVASDQMGDKTCEIRLLMLFPYVTKHKSREDHEHFAMIGGINEQDVTVWEVPSFECRDILSSHQETPRLKKYTLKKLEPSKDTLFEMALSNFTLELDQMPVRCNTSLAHVVQSGTHTNDKVVIATSTRDNRVILWNMNDISQSTLLLGSQKAAFIRREITPNVSICYEKLSPPSKDAAERGQEPVRGTITDLAMATNPYPMIIAAERNGSIHVYK